jgi:LuxR family maltose regulon positive regulatory protein
MAAPLLKTKLYIPPVRAESVPRPRLVERLTAGLDRKLTLISAPAGFGKTTLLSECVGVCGRPVAWVSLDKGDNDPVRFWTYCIAALQTIHKGVGETALAAFQSPGVAGATALPAIETLVTGLINDMARIPESLALVLDDLHVIAEHQIHEALTLLVDNLPPQMHLIVASRADPPWPLARLRVRGEMTELRADDLRFTPQEVAALLNESMQLGLSPEDVTTLENRTEGWIAGLQMAALSLHGRRQSQGVRDLSGFIKAFTGSHRFILDYLVEEVLDQQSREVQEFLLKTSILERMTAPLCDVVTDRDDGGRILAHLDQANLFVVPLDEERRWYRYHRLFADLLRSQLLQTQPDQVPGLHRRASEWCEQNGLMAEAVSHALAADDLEQAVHLIEGNALTMIYHGELATLMGWLDALPDSVVRSRPWLCVARAWALVNAARLESVESLLQDAEAALVGADEQADEQRIAGHIAAVRTYSAGLRGEMTLAAELARQALEQLPEGDSIERSFVATIRAFALRRIGELAAAAQAFDEAVAMSQAGGNSHITLHTLSGVAGLAVVRGQLHRAAATFREALQLADEYARRDGRKLPIMGLLYSGMSAVLREWNDLEAASRLAKEGVKLSEHWGQPDILLRGYVEVAAALQAMGDVGGALAAMRKALQVVSGLPSWATATLTADEARLRLAQGDLAAAGRWAQESGLSADDDMAFQDGFMYVTLARVRIAQGRPDEALRLLERLLTVVEAAGAVGSTIEILALQAMAWQARGGTEQALIALGRALSLAEPEGYVRTFIDEGKPMGNLMRQAAGRGMAPNYVGKLLAALEEGTKDVRPPTIPPSSVSEHPSLVEPISEREMEVLRLLTTSLSSTEIAEELLISVSTVRSHIKSIYGKLDVHRRLDAVERAKDLGLL